MTRPDFAPAVRFEVKFLRTSKPSVLVATYGEARHELYEVEGRFIQEMDGSRDVDELTRRAQVYFPGATRQQVEQFIVQAAAMGLLSNLGPGEATPQAVAANDSPTRDEAAPSPAPTVAAEVEAAEPWVPDRVPWYRHARARRLLPLVLVTAALGAGALITYPRYVTDECVVLPLRRSEVRAEIDGILAEIFVDEGDRVRAGDVLAQLDGRDVNAALRQAQADVERLTANVEKMRSGFRKEEVARSGALLSARANEVRFARLEAAREERLFAEQVSSAEKRESAALRLQLAWKAWAQAKADHDLMQAGFRPEDIKLAEAELQRAEVEVQHLEKKHALLTLRSPIDGQVVTPRFRERLHERIVSGGTLCEVAATATMRVETFVSERELDVVAVDQPVTVKVEGYPLHPFTGRVVFISPAVEEREGRRVLRVVTAIDNPDGLLRPSMTGYGEIHTGRSPLLVLASRRLVRWVRLRFLI